MIVLITSNHLQELEWILDRTTSDLMGKCLLCWVTVVLWVRVARNRECHISEEAVWYRVGGVNNSDWSMATNKRKVSDGQRCLLASHVENTAGLSARASQDVTQTDSFSCFCLPVVQEMEPYLPITSKCARLCLSGATVLFWVSICTKSSKFFTIMHFSNILQHTQLSPAVS